MRTSSADCVSAEQTVNIEFHTVFHQFRFDVSEDCPSISNAFGSFGSSEPWAVLVFVYFIPVALIKLFF
jgi:hypothetical protein